jgi:hypothetical protein
VVVVSFALIILIQGWSSFKSGFKAQQFVKSYRTSSFLLLLSVPLYLRASSPPSTLHPVILVLLRKEGNVY